MGWKMKKMISLGVVLALVYYQQSGNAWASEEQDRKCFEVECPNPDGESGYYVTRPEVKITQVSEVGVTQYCFVNGEGQELKGELRETKEQAVIGTEQMTEGENSLSVWMEEKTQKPETGGSEEEQEDGEEQEGGEKGEGEAREESKEGEEEDQKEKKFLQEYKFSVDTIPPKLQFSVPQGIDVWYQNETQLSVAAADEEPGSGVAWTSCRADGEELGSSGKAETIYRVKKPSREGKAVQVMVYARDRAGNQAQKSAGLYIDGQAPKAGITGVIPYQITSQPVEIHYAVEEENEVGNASAKAVRQDPKGTITELFPEAWTKTENGKMAMQRLTEDGIYQLEMEAFDQSGHSGRANTQVIIDRENPIIYEVERLDQRYLKSFRWELPPGKWIWDFTSYTYTMLLDGKLYPMGETVSGEGWHTLEVKAVDAAGNIGVSRADFVIDHSAPKIVFRDVREGESYEEERTFQVTLEDQSDVIEKIQINGKEQPIQHSSKSYQYTVQEHQDYEVTVKAKDRAGNQAVTRIHFRIKAKETMLDRVMKPVKKSLGMKVEETGTGSDKKEKEERTRWIWMIGSLLIGSGAAAIGYWYWKQKNSCKREDAG